MNFQTGPRNKTVSSGGPSYQLTNAVWEITYACNMRCMHCGSICGEPLADELTTDEALELCDDLVKLGLQKMTLSGGEPLVRKDWHLLAKRLSSGGVITNIISNGWFIDDQVVDRAFEAGLSNMGMSLDGLEETHDQIRKKGSYQRIIKALDLLKKRGMPTSINTSLNKINFKELPALREILIRHGVSRWQFQIARPMGSFTKHNDLVIEPEDIDCLIDFAYETAMEGRLKIYLGDDIGYYGIKHLAIIRHALDNPRITCPWMGCYAGKQVIGIRANGDISGCLSIRDDSYIEDNIRKRNVVEIWNDPESFAWNRRMTKKDLTGFCARCAYGAQCLGGCTGSKISLSPGLGENPYCSYKQAIEKEEKRLAALEDVDQLILGGQKLVAEKAYQLADLYFRRALELKPDHTGSIDYLGFINFFLGNYGIARDYNLKALKLNPKNAYAHKGLGLCLARLGEVEKGIKSITRGIELTGQGDSEYYLDLAVVLDENGRTREGLKILDNVRKHFPGFKIKSEGLYKLLREKLGA